MSGSPKNIQRDAIWINPDTTDNVGWGSQFSPVAATPVFDNSGSVNVDYGVAQMRENATITAGNVVAAGVLMDKIAGDNVPFRIKACVQLGGSIIVGWADASPTGSDDNINDAFFIPFVYTFDDLIMVPDSDTYTDRSLCVAIAPQPPSGLSASPLVATLSVQSLGVKPPTMHFTVP